MNLNILWIDDDYKTQEDFISFAEQDGIDIHPFESHEEGMASLGAKPNFYHAAILDAKVKNKKEDTVTGLDGLRASRDRLIEMNKDHYLPFFIFTGQPDYISNEMFVQSYGAYYTKGDDNQKLLDDIIAACGNQPEIQARKSFPEVFTAFDKNILSNSSKKLLVDIIQNIDNKCYFKKNIAPQRDLLEAILKSLNNPIPCMPDNFYDSNLKGKPILDYCIRFLEDYSDTKDRQGNSYRLNKKIAKDKTYAFRKLKETACEFNHLDENDIHKYPFLSNSFLLFEILIWLPEFVQEHYENYI